MKPKVSFLWRMAAIFILGALFGALITVKWIIPTPSQDITIGKVVVRAKKGSTVTDGVDITKQDTQTEDNSKTKTRLRRKDKK